MPKHRKRSKADEGRKRSKKGKSKGKSRRRSPSSSSGSTSTTSSSSSSATSSPGRSPSPAQRRKGSHRSKRHQKAGALQVYADFYRGLSLTSPHFSGSSGKGSQVAGNYHRTHDSNKDEYLHAGTSYFRCALAHFNGPGLSGTYRHREESRHQRGADKPGRSPTRDRRDPLAARASRWDDHYQRSPSGGDRDRQGQRDGRDPPDRRLPRRSSPNYYRRRSPSPRGAVGKENRRD